MTALDDTLFCAIVLVAACSRDSEGTEEEVDGLEAEEAEDEVEDWGRGTGVPRPDAVLGTLTLTPSPVLIAASK